MFHQGITLKTKNHTFIMQIVFINKNGDLTNYSKLYEDI